MNNSITVDFEKNNNIDIKINKDKRELSVDINPKNVVPSYKVLPEKPSINNEVLLGNKTSKDLHLQDEMDALTVQEIEKILYLD